MIITKVEISMDDTHTGAHTHTHTYTHTAIQRKALKEEILSDI